MTDYQRLVDEIRAFIQGNDQSQTDRLQELGKAYAEACREVNQRLRRCEEYLKKGLRSEAIHFAEAEPVLLDAVAILDFPELPTFQVTLEFYGIPEPPRIQLEIAQDLNQAYAEEQPLEDLLPRHRRLALLRAPVVERLEVLRQIAQVDKNNPVWGDDIRLFETARLREIKAAMAGLDREDAVRIAEFARELSEPDWLTPPPAALTEQVGRQAALLTRQQRRLELAGVVDQLAAAMETADLALAQTLRDQYHELAEAAQVPVTDPLVLKAARPLKWLTQREKTQQREMEVQTALAALEDALTEQADVEEVAQLYEEALRVVDALPSRLERRYRAYVKREDSSRRWRESLIFIIVAFVGVLLLVGLIGFLILKNRSHQNAAAATRLTVACLIRTPECQSLTPLDPLRDNCHG